MRKNKKIKGFSLIEIMMVLFIFMIMISFVAINANFNFNETTKMQNLASNIFSKIKLAKQEAILQHSTIKFTIENGSYGFQKLTKIDKEYKWDWITSDSLLENTKIDKNIVLMNSNSLVIYPNGSFTPFQLTLKSEKNKTYFTIYGDNDGNIGLSKNAN